MTNNFILLFEYIGIAFIMMFLPFIHIIIAIRGKKDVEPLHVNLNYSKNPRYMTEPFETYFYQSFPKEQLIDGNILEDKKVGRVEVVSQKTIAQAGYYEMFYLLDSVIFPKKSSIKREIFAQEDVTLQEYTRVRAIRSKGNIFLHDNCKIQRWLDADKNIIVGKNICLNIVYANGYIRLEKGTKFKRLYGHPIQTSHKIQYSLLQITKENREQLHSNIRDNLLYINDKEAFIEKDKHIQRSVISQHNLTLGNNIYINGDIKSNGKLYVGEKCIINGNLFAEEDIYISKKCFISGNVFSHKNIYICEGTQIATEKHTKSVVTKGTVKIEKNVTIFSYVLADEEGEIV